MSFCNRVERVVNYLFYNLIFIFDCTEVEAVLYDNKVTGFHNFRENLLPYSSFVEDRKFFLKNILFSRYVVPTGILLQYQIIIGCKQRSLTLHRDLTLHLDLS
jgi:hypothetical protein